MPKLKCALSDKPCNQCEQNSDCLIYSEKYVLTRQLKKLVASLDDTATIAKAIISK